MNPPVVVNVRDFGPSPPTTWEEELDSAIAALEGLRKAQRGGLGERGRAEARRTLSQPEIEAGTKRIEEVWARSGMGGKEGLFQEEQALFQQELQSHLAHFLRTYQTGARPPGSARWWIQREIREGFERLFLLGREKSGKTGPLSLREKRYLKTIRYRDFHFLRGFLIDVDEGKGRMDYQRRMALYAAGGSQAYWAGMVFGASVGQRFRWVLGPAEHCESCLRISRGGPYGRNYLVKNGLFPKCHSLDCVRGCKCRLVPV